MLAGNGGHPKIGMELKAAFLNAGFTDPRAGASFDFYDTPKDIAFFYSVAAGWFLSPQVIGAAIKFGWLPRSSSTNGAPASTSGKPTPQPPVPSPLESAWPSSRKITAS